MPKASSKKKRSKSEDTVQAAARSMQAFAERTERDAEPEMPEITDEMRAAAAAFGRIGGKIGGVKRAEKLSAKRRAEIARKAAAARWNR